MTCRCHYHNDRLFWTLLLHQ